MVDVQWIGVIRIYYICIVLDVITFHNSLVNNQRMKKEKGEDVCRGYNSSTVLNMFRCCFFVGLRADDRVYKGS